MLRLTARLATCGWLLAATATSGIAGQIVSEPFLGVRQYQRVDVSPRPLFINVLEIDLAAPGLSFRMTPRGPNPAPIVGGIPDETLTQTTRQFVDQQGAQLAINGSFYRVDDAAASTWTNDLGLTASNGDKYSAWESFFFSNDTTFASALNITQNNQAAIVTAPLSRPTGFETSPVVPIYNALTGNYRILTNGLNVAPPPNPNDAQTQLQPRTAVGVTAANKLIMMTVDGRQSGFSEGVTLVELAGLLSNYGAVNAINLDGGGSTSMALNYFGDKDLLGNARSAQLVNSAIGLGNVATERYVGTSLGLFAAANPAYQPKPAPQNLPASVAILDSFESSEGRFTSGPAGSGSTFGVSTESTFDRVNNESYFGQGAQRLVVLSSDPAAPGSGLRHLSGGGAPGSNAALAASGYVGYLVKVHDNGIHTGDVQASLLIDDGAGLERAAGIDLIADGQWHLYQWNLDDPNRWFNFSGGNGQIDAATVTIDSLYFTSAQNLDFTVFVDVVAHNPSGELTALVPEPSGLALLATALVGCIASGVRRLCGCLLPLTSAER